MSGPRYALVRGQTGGNWRNTGRSNQLSRSIYQRLVPANPAPENMIITNDLFVRGMKLKGPGSNPLRRTGNKSKKQESGLYYQVGSGTTQDPTVAWCFDVAASRHIDPVMRQAHVEIARKVAKANNFQCILIRKELHDRGCTYDEFNNRTSVMGANGRQHTVVAPADDHMTVWMGPDTSTAMVGGHIFVVRARNPSTGRLELRQMDDPATQRSIVHLGRQKVAEEFWLTKNAWEAAD
jgi:hypothetical protein